MVFIEFSKFSLHFIQKFSKIAIPFISILKISLVSNVKSNLKVITIKIDEIQIKDQNFLTLVARIVLSNWENLSFRHQSFYILKLSKIHDWKLVFWFMKLVEFSVNWLKRLNNNILLCISFQRWFVTTLMTKNYKVIPAWNQLV